jgi:hypothetical protein
VQVACDAGFTGAEIFDEDLDPSLTAFVNRQPWMAFGAVRRQTTP